MLRWNFNNRTLKRLLALVMAVVLSVGVCVVPAFADAGAYTIKDYYIEGILHANNEMQVTEQIKVYFSEPRHGIYRCIPNDFEVGEAFTGRGGLRYHAKVKDITVSEASSIESQDGYQNIRMGDADIEVVGEHDYELRYTYSMPDDRIEAKDLLYYSVLGAEWQTTIDHFGFHVTFEKPLTQQEVDGFQLYSGSYGLEENALGVDYTVTQDGITGEVYDIAPEQAITLFCSLQSGYFEGARKVSPLITGLFSVLTAILLVVGTGLSLVNRVRHWRKPVETVEFYAPEGMSPAEVGVIIDNRTDDRDMLSLIPWWAEQGYLRMEDFNEQDKVSLNRKEEKGLVLVKLKELPKGAPKYQKKMFDALFDGDRNRMDMNKADETFYDKYCQAKHTLTEHFKGERALIRGGIQAFGVTAALSFFYCAALAFASAVCYGYHLWMTVCLLAVMVWFGIVARLGAEQGTGLFSGMKRIIGMAILALVSAGIVSLVLEDDVLLPKIVYWWGFCAVVVVQVLSRWVIYSTDYRNSLIGKLAGLKRFIKTAELPKLKILLDENPSYYYGILPYAIAFGLTDKWAKCFTELPQMQPTWYKSYAPNYIWEIGYFYHYLDRGFTQPIEHIACEIAPSSSSSGGLSGGGGGGGGGS